MANLQKGSCLARSLILRGSQLQLAAACSQRWAATSAAAQASNPHLDDLEPISSLVTPGPDEATVQAFDTASRLSSRTEQLPGSRYQYHPPKYNRGPLHPVQSPPSSDPQARDFVPGPFNFPRLRDTYESTLAADLMTMTYLHKPPGSPDPPERVRLRSWDDSSPYHKNRPLRGPRGSSNLPILERNIDWRNIPEIKAVSVNVFAPRATQNRDYLHIARSVVQAITGCNPEATRVKTSVVQWKIRKGDITGAKATMYGNAAYEFVDKIVHLVLPKVKDWPGMKANAGDGSGTVAFGFNAGDMKFFPELEVNYDLYPTKMLPGCHVFIHTTATSDRQARLLLQTLGFPFYHNK